MKPILVALIIFFGGGLLGSGTAHADDTFETKAAGAQRIHRLENLVWALTASCDAGDDTQKRQCKHVRDARAAELTSGKLLIDADSDAFDVGAFSTQKKSVPVVLSSCIRCGGVDLEGKTWYVVGTGTAPVFDGGKLHPPKLYDNARAFADEAAAQAWAKAVANVRVQMLVKIPAKPKWQVDGKNGLALEILGYRVYSACDGSIVGASPTSGPAEADKKQCAKVVAQPVEDETAKGPTVELTASVIREAMQPVVDASHACFENFGVAGKAKLRITIGQDGSILKYEQQGEFEHTPTGECIDKAMGEAKFPRSKKPKTSIAFPITLQ
ncbi:MAG: hypothetical protein JWO36_7537 [Myxococcales bacterium]|nr:hypothetical protein [Myxococcales bacterium]